MTPPAPAPVACSSARSTMADSMSTQPSRLTLADDGDRTIIASGVIDSHTADDLLGRVKAMGNDGDVTVELSGIEFIDSSGLRTLVSAHQLLGETDHKLVLTGISESVERLFEIIGLREHLNVEE